MSLVSRKKDFWHHHSKVKAAKDARTPEKEQQPTAQSHSLLALSVLAPPSINPGAEFTKYKRSSNPTLWQSKSLARRGEQKAGEREVLRSPRCHQGHQDFEATFLHPCLKVGGQQYLEIGKKNGQRRALRTRRGTSVRDLTTARQEDWGTTFNKSGNLNRPVKYETRKAGLGREKKGNQNYSQHKDPASRSSEGRVRPSPLCTAPFGSDVTAQWSRQQEHFTGAIPKHQNKGFLKRDLEKPVAGLKFKTRAPRVRIPALTFNF